VKKLCPTHKTRHLLFPDDGRKQTYLCIHPKCIEKAIRACINKYPPSQPSFKIITSKRQVEDFVSFITLELYEDKEKGRELISINPKWLWFRIINYVNRHIRHNIPMAEQTTGNRKGKTFRPLTPEIIEEMDEIIKIFNNLNSLTLEDKLIREDLVNKIERDFGKNTVLYFIDAISQADFAKLEGIKITEARERLQKAKVEMREWLEYNNPFHYGKESKRGGGVSGI
tara:strand:+ start:3098 stop:3778 length:681 start_codon:yes stop_codon:yes gene_type:complete